ncbi:MAG: hypothetical protein HOQ29_09845 [Acidobacteria bacterium]|nr:hypothetical protein [Acidobacteriota bacterium]
MSVIELWWLSLAVFAAVIVIVAVLLGVIIAAAKSIDRHAGAIWIVGKEIAGNTVAIWMLEQTVGSLQRLSDSTRRLEQKIDRLHAALAGKG